MRPHTRTMNWPVKLCLVLLLLLLLVAPAMPASTALPHTRAYLKLAAKSRCTNAATSSSVLPRLSVKGLS